MKHAAQDKQRPQSRGLLQRKNVTMNQKKEEKRNPTEDKEWMIIRSPADDLTPKSEVVGSTPWT